MFELRFFDQIMHKPIKVIFITLFFILLVNSSLAVNKNTHLFGLGVGYESTENENKNFNAQMFYKFNWMQLNSRVLFNDEQIAIDFLNIGLVAPISNTRNSMLFFNAEAGLSFLTLRDRHFYEYNQRIIEYNYDPILNLTSKIEMRWEFEHVGLAFGYRQRFAPEFLDTYEEINNGQIIIHKPNSSKDDNRNYVDFANYMIDKFNGWYLNFHVALNSFFTSHEEKIEKKQKESNYGVNGYAYKPTSPNNYDVQNLELEFIANNEYYSNQSDKFKIKVKNRSAYPAKNVELDIQTIDEHIQPIEDRITLGRIPAFSAKVIEVPFKSRRISTDEVEQSIAVYAKLNNYKSNTLMGQIKIVGSATNADIANLSVYNIELIDDNENNKLDSKERAVLKLTLRNNSYKVLNNLKVELSTDDQTIEIIQPKERHKILSYDTKSILYAIKASTVNSSTKIPFVLKVNDKELESNKLFVEVQKNKTPNLILSAIEINDAASLNSSGNGNSIIENMETIEVSLNVKNTGDASTNNTNLNIEIGDRNIVYLNDKWNFKLGSISPNETKAVSFSFLVNNRYKAAKTLPIFARVKESGKTFLRENLKLELNKLNPLKKNEYQYVQTQNSTVDVDVNIPISNQKRENTYALIIGNEDYASYQITNKTNVNVDYAINDAKIFKEYSIKTLGIPSKNITYIENATVGKINQAIDKLQKLNKITKKSNILFYYAGHGMAHEQNKDAYIMPVDIDPGNIEFAIKLEDISNNLAQANPNRVTMILDACFSGATRNSSLNNYRGAVVRPKANFKLKNNVIILSSSTGVQSSGVYQEKKHGLFTYFLLKKLQSTKGDVSFGDLLNYLDFEVQKNSLLINNKEQKPTIKIGGEDIEKELKQLKL